MMKDLNNIIDKVIEYYIKIGLQKERRYSSFLSQQTVL